MRVGGIGEGRGRDGEIVLVGGMVGVGVGEGVKVTDGVMDLGIIVMVAMAVATTDDGVAG